MSANPSRATSVGKIEADFELEYHKSKPRHSEATILSRTVINNLLVRNTKTQVPSTYKTLAVLATLIFGLTVAVTCIILANTSSNQTLIDFKFTTLFYNVTMTTVQFTSTSENEVCGNQDWISDGQCDDEANKVECQHDGGDCCLPNPTLSFCTKCLCHLANESTNLEDDEIEERVLLIIGGKTDDDQNTEVIFNSSIVDKHFLPSYPKSRIGTFGGFFEDWLMSLVIVCGGVEESGPEYGEEDWYTVSDECYTIDTTTDFEWQFFSAMNKPRANAASIVVDGKLWITGGDTGGYEPELDMKSEFLDPINPGMSLEGPDMPFTFIARHCLALVNSYQVMLIGGEAIENGDWICPRKTFVYDFSIEQWRNGPKIATGRTALGCSRFTDENKVNWTIISGGMDVDGARIETTEMLADISSEWILGPSLPWYLYNHKMINFMDQVMIIGGISNKYGLKDSSTQILQLMKISNDQYSWVLSEISLENSRTTPFTVMNVPASLIL